MIPLLIELFLLAVVVQLYFILFVYPKLISYSNSSLATAKEEGVSVIVCAWNEKENLQELLPILDKQDYANFEVIVVDDRSWDGTYDFLLAEIKYFPHCRFLRIEETPEHLSSKKYALTLGIKAAKHPVILLTDADCRPQSTRWIRAMASSLTADKDIVLGFSPYFKEGTKLLNGFIAYETFITAMQYLSFALAGKPYMGVGRNLLYRKSVFMQNRGFASHTHVLGGDDDLFMNEVANKENTAICVDSDSFVYSFPKTTWHDWYRQKKRHLSVGKYYTLQNKVTLGLLVSSQIFYWICFFALLPVFWHSPFLWGLLGLFLLRLGALWIVYAKVNTRLAATLPPVSIPAWDFALSAYFFIMGINNAIPRRKKMRWR